MWKGNPSPSDSALKRREYYHKNKEKILEQRKGYRKYLSSEYDKFLDWRYKREYNISLEDYKNLLIQQQGLCALCGGVETTKDKRTAKTKRLAVDHCHTTGKVRGLLCSSCNIGLGRFKDDPVLLNKAIQYIKGTLSVHSS